MISFYIYLHSFLNFHNLYSIFELWRQELEITQMMQFCPTFQLLILILKKTAITKIQLQVADSAKITKEDPRPEPEDPWVVNSWFQLIRHPNVSDPSKTQGNQFRCKFLAPFPVSERIVLNYKATISLFLIIPRRVPFGILVYPFS